MKFSYLLKSCTLPLIGALFLANSSYAKPSPMDFDLYSSIGVPDELGPDWMMQELLNNQQLMRIGNAPFAPRTQGIPGRGKYELHHIEPISQGGNVYGVSNMMIISPRFHLEVLERGYHYGF